MPTQLFISLGREIEPFVPEKVLANNMSDLQKKVIVQLEKNIRNRPMIIFTEENLEWLKTSLVEMSKRYMIPLY